MIPEIYGATGEKLGEGFFFFSNSVRWLLWKGMKGG